MSYTSKSRKLRVRKCITLIRRFIAVDDAEPHDRAMEYDAFGDTLAKSLRRNNNEPLAALVDAFMYQVTDVAEGNSEEDISMDDDQQLEEHVEDEETPSERTIAEDYTEGSAETSSDDTVDTDDEDDETESEEDEDDDDRFVTFENLLDGYLEDFRAELKEEL